MRIERKTIEISLNPSSTIYCSPPAGEMHVKVKARRTAIPFGIAATIFSNVTRIPFRRYPPRKRRKYENRQRV